MSTINMSSILAKAKKATEQSAVQKRLEEKVDMAYMASMGGGSGGGGGATLNGGFGGFGGGGGGGGGGAGAATAIASTPPDNPADKFIEVLQNEIKNCFGTDYSSGRLGQTAVDVLVKLKRGNPIKCGKYKYQIPVRFADNLHRDSLYKSGYPMGVENIAALLNTGYDTGKRVYGIWHGEKIASLQHRDGARFIESAIRTFMANYASKYGVIDIKVDDAYK